MVAVTPIKNKIKWQNEVADAPPVAALKACD